MHHNKTDIQGAMNWVHDYHKELEAKFMDLYENKMPNLESRAGDQWGFESERYFGKKGPEIGKRGG
ncbi:hypothetical protein H4582DRAFT_2019362 [Lactarius indigo]|nr:hypothetical protein H4582DRAFT_2019362 [Lactarius indigo]